MAYPSTWQGKINLPDSDATEREFNADMDTLEVMTYYTGGVAAVEYNDGSRAHLVATECAVEHFGHRIPEARIREICEATKA